MAMSHSRHPVWGYQVMKVVRRSFCHNPHNPKDKSQGQMQKEADLRDKIEAICLEYPRYGYSAGY